MFEVVAERVLVDDLKPRRRSPEWIRVRRDVAPLEATACENCGTQYWTVRASDGCETHVKSLCKKDAWCYACSYRRSMELTNDLVRLVAKLSGEVRQKVRFWRWELTIPHRDIQKRMTVDDGYEFGKEAQRYMESYIRERFNLAETVQLGGVMVFQFVHSSDPYGVRAGDDKRHMHYHGVILGWGVSKEDWSTVRFPSSLFIKNDRKFKLLRAGWKAVLESKWGKTSANDIDAFIRYESGTDELFHRGRYQFRGAVEDFVKCASSVRDGYSREWVMEALSWKKGRPSVRYYGFLSPRNLSPKSPLMKRLVLVIPKKVIRVKEARRVFCDHGCEYEVQFHEPLKTLAEIEVESGTVLVRRRIVSFFEGG